MELAVALGLGFVTGSCGRQLAPGRRSKKPGFDKMRQARHLHPVWGVLAPTPGVVRMVRVLAVFTAIGATAGSGVALSLVKSAPDQAVVADIVAAPVAAPSLLLSAQVKSRNAVENEPARIMSPVVRAKHAARLAQAEKKTSKKHHAEPRYAARGGRQFSSLMDDWYHAVGL